MRLTPFRIATLALAVGMFAAPGCVVVNASGSAESEDAWPGAGVRKTLTVEVAHADNTPLKASTENGSIEIVRGTGAVVEITAEIRARTQQRLDATGLRAERAAGGELRVWLQWPEGKRENNEGASLTIRLPNAAAVTAETSNGKVTIEGVGAQANVITSNAAVQVAQIPGPVDIRTSNGSVEIDTISGDARVKTSNARILARGVKGKADLTTSNGSVELSVDDSAAAPFSVSTSNASVRVDLAAGFNGEVSASTSNGSIRFSDPRGEEKTSKGSQTRTFGAGGEKSRVSTSNGSVTVQVRG